MGLLSRIEELEKELLELKELAKEEQEFPQVEDDYWCVDDDAEVSEVVWYGDDYDQVRFSIGNVFKTKEQAEFAVEKLKVETELRKFGRHFKDNDNNYFMKIDSIYNTIIIYYDGCYQTQGVIYFESEKKAEEAIESVGEERIKKYIFGMEEQ